MSSPRKTKAPKVAASGALKNNHLSLQFSDPRTATEQQHIVMLEELRRRPQTTCDFRARGILQVSARIFGLRAKNYVIETTRISMVDHIGVLHSRAALYTLISEPESGAA